MDRFALFLGLVFAIVVTSKASAVVCKNSRFNWDLKAQALLPSSSPGTSLFSSSANECTTKIGNLQVFEVKLNPVMTKILAEGRLHLSLESIFGSDPIIYRNKILDNITLLHEEYTKGNNIFSGISENSEYYINNENHQFASSHLSQIEISSKKEIFNPIYYYITEYPDALNFSTIYNTSNWPKNYQMYYGINYSSDWSYFKNHYAIASTVLWRYLNNSDISNYRKNKEKFFDYMKRGLFPDAEGVYSGNVDNKHFLFSDPMFNFLSFLRKYNIPEDFALIAALPNTEECGSSGNYIFNLLTRELNSKVVVIKNISSSPISIQNIELNLDAIESIKELELLNINKKVETGPMNLAPGQVIVIPTEATFEPLAGLSDNNSELNLKYGFQAGFPSNPIHQQNEDYYEESNGFKISGEMSEAEVAETIYKRINSYRKDIEFHLRQIEVSPDLPTWISKDPVFKKKASQFRKPVFPNYNSKYYFSDTVIDYSIFVKNEKLTPSTQTPAYLTGTYGDTEAGSCPILRVFNPEKDSWVSYGEVLGGHLGIKNKGKHSTEIEGFFGKIMLTEEEVEKTLLDQAYIVDFLTGEKYFPEHPVLRKIDENYAKLLYPRSIILNFPGYIKKFGQENARKVSLHLTGYYTKIDLGASVFNTKANGREGR